MVEQQNEKQKWDKDLALVIAVCQNAVAASKSFSQVTYAFL